MTDDDFQRARRPEQKEERRLLLLETAREMLLRDPNGLELSLNELAKSAGMAKSNVYRYFESREAIFIELLRREWLAWFNELERSFACRPPCSGPRQAAGRARLVRDFAALDDVVERLAQTMTQRPLLGLLCSVLSAVLERNVDPETVRSFKLESLEFIGKLAKFLHATCADLTTAQYEELFHTGFAALVGLWSFSHPAPAVAEVLRAPELAPFRHDFGRDYARHLSLLARGLVMLDTPTRG